MGIREHHTRPAVATPADHGQLLSQGTLELMARATAEQHKSIIELQGLFARHGGDLSTHFLTAEEPNEEIDLLDDLKSFAVLNFSAVTIYVGFGGRSATPGNGFPIPPASYMQLPVETNVMVIGATTATLEGVEDAMVAVIRFRHLVNFIAGPLSASSSAGGGGGSSSAAVVSAHSPRKVAVGVASALVIAANPERKGLSIENNGAASVSLGLGAAAAIGDDIVLEPGGSWNGTISGVLWTGAVNSIAAAAGALSVVEL